MNTPVFTVPGFTDEIPVGCSCPGCAATAAGETTADRVGAGRVGVCRAAVVATVGVVALAGAGTGTALAEPAPAHAGWDGTKYWYKNAAGEWRWTSHQWKYEQNSTGGAGTGAGTGTGTGQNKTPTAKYRSGAPVFPGRQGWDPRYGVYWYKYNNHWYWTSHQWKYEQRTDTSGRPSKPSKPSNPAPPTPPSTRGWTVPVSSYVFTGYYGQPGSWSKGYHTGQDFAVPTGTTVRSVGPGRVVSTGYNRSYGYEVVVRHADGRYSQYAHLSRIDVSSGQSVSAGQRIALSGETGRVTGPHLHFEVRTTPYFGSDVNPLAYLRSHGVAV
ncbi:MULTISPECIES: M23 family metallopeptidase [unclassified Streptomyces]|uniref:M23 family metallopeptidase n=1 Tax=unclassified Streptomyces TaxID=2593676 RepID=UPI0035D96907